MSIIKRICPICAIVALTWTSMFAWKLAGHPVNEVLLAMLMGGSAVGISYVLGSRMQTGNPMIWKLVAIPIGFAAMYALLSFAWLYAGIAVAAYAVAWYAFRSTVRMPDQRQMQDITKALDNCCD